MNKQIAARRIYEETPVRALMRGILGLARGRFVGVTFTKIDGTERHILCKVTDVDPTRKYATVKDMVKREYRRINLDDVLSIRLAGKELRVQ